MQIIIAQCGEVLKLGFGNLENEARRVEFDISAWQQSYGDGVVQLLATREGDTSVYPAVVTVEDGKAYWTLTAADLARPGYGYAELVYRVGDTVAASAPFVTYTAYSLGSTEGDAPEQSWVQEVLAAGAAAVSAALRAETAAASAEADAQNAAAAKTAAEAARNSAEASAASALISKQDAQAAKLAAESSADDAAASQHSAEVSATAARDAKEDAETAKAAAETAQGKAETAQASAEAAAGRAENAAEELRDTIEEVEQLRVDVDNKTEKYRIDFDGATFTHDDETLNYQQLHDVHLVSPDFAFVVYGDRAYLLSYVQDDPGAMRELRFESVIATVDVVKTSGIYVISNDGVNIAGITTRAINSENQGNKVSEITAANKASVVNYPSNKAVTNHVEEKIAPIDSRLEILEAAARGELYTEVVDSTEAYSKSVPAGTFGSRLDSVSAVTQKWNASRFNDSVTEQGARKISDNEIEYTASRENSYPSCTSMVVGHKYYMTMRNGTSATVNWYVDTAGYSAYLRASAGESVTGILTAVTRGNFVATGAVAVGDRIYAQYHDLTAIYGAGNEPTTVDDPRIAVLDAIAAARPQYDAGSLIDFVPSAVTAHGRNLFKADTAELTNVTRNGNSFIVSGSNPQIDYKLSAGSYVVSLKASATVYLRKGKVTEGTLRTLNSSNNWTGVITLDEDAYLRFSSFAASGSVFSDIMIVSGSTAMPYSPYYTETLTLPESEAVQHGVGTAHDEIDLENGNYVKRMTTITLSGNEDWSVLGAGTTAARAVIGKPSTIVRDNRNGVCVDFIFGNATLPNNFDLDSTYIRFNVTGYATTAAEWKAYLRQHPVTIIAELVDPVVTPLSAINPYLHTEGGGSVTFENGTEIAVPLPSKLTHFIDVEEALV